MPLSAVISVQVVLRDDQVGVVAHERAVARRERRLLHGAAEAPDEVAGEVLQRGEAAARAVVGRRRPAADPPQPGEHVVEHVVGGVGGVPRPDRLPDRRAVEPGEVDLAGDGAVLDVVHGVGDVVGEVHDLRLDAAAPCRPAPDPDPVERRPVVVVHAELGALPGHAVAVDAARRGRVGDRPGVLRAGVERRPGQVEADRAPDASAVFASSRVSRRSVWALPSNPPQLGGEPVERPLAVVPERRVPEVVRERRGLGDVGVSAERAGEVARDLGDLEAVRQPVADEVVALRARPPGSWQRAGGTTPRGRRARGRARTACAPARRPASAVPARSARGPRRRTAPRRPPPAGHYRSARGRRLASRDPAGLAAVRARAPR